MKKRLFGAALAVAAAVLTTVSLPPAALTLETPFSDGTIPGIVHVHTNRSDGRGTPDEIAAAAARAGLKFVVFTDHGDATRPPDAPAYRSGVLCLDAVEISTTGGHYLALDMPASPYPLGGEARDVAEDVKRLGGFGVAAHPNSPKPTLSWRDWDAPFDGVEWLNPDTSWRIKLRQSGWRQGWNVITTLSAYAFRSPETVTRLLGDTGIGAAAWESFAHQRRVVLLAGADAHANLPLTSGDPSDTGFALPIPSYETTFRVLSIRVRPDRPLTGEAVRDATTIMQAIRRGHLYVAIDGRATPPAFQFTATNARGTAGAGDALESGGSVTLRIRSNAPSSFVTRLWRDGEPIAEARDEVDLTRTVPDGPAVYRAEIVTAAGPGAIPWIISNPIYVGVTFPAAAPPPAATESRLLFDGQATKWWRSEVSPQSSLGLDATPAGELRIRYQLSSVNPPGPYAAAGVELPDGAAPSDRLSFTARADRPMRLSVRFRRVGPPAEHWQRSVYIDETPRDRTIRFADVTAVDAARTPQPVPRDIHDILFVVETTNSKAGSAGQVWLQNVRLQR
ncbi:MAG: CehA/McbA family metallohydrolase [Acidobacteriota bacterium]